MTGPKPYRTTHRWILLGALTKTTVPLDINQLAARTGINRSTVRDALVRPRAARWVTATPASGKLPHNRKLVYTITDRGRQALFEHLATPDKEG